MPNISIADGLYLLHKQLASTAPTVVAEIPTDHVVIIDCSGSMTYELPNIRAQLKNKLPMMMKDGDSVSIIWFSGRTQFGVVIENVVLKSAVDLAGVHRAIDNLLRPIGLTGFVEPLREAAALIGRIQKPGRAINLFFMSDGYDNQWSKAEILARIDELNPMVSSAAVVEYGYYCNKPLMVDMAARLGATEVLSANFSQYEPLFETAMTKRIMGIKKVEVDIGQTKHGFAFTLSGNEVLTFAAEGGKISVPEGTTDVYWFAELPPSANFYSASQVQDPKFPNQDATLAPMYASLVPLCQRMVSNDIYRVLKALGDCRLIEGFVNCFGKQAYRQFQDDAQECAFTPAGRYTDGYNPNMVPAEDAYTLIDLLHDLQAEGNLFYPNHEAFKYDRIGRKAEQAGLGLTAEEEARLDEIVDEMSKTRDTKKLRVLNEEMLALTTPKAGLRFVPDDENAGHPIDALVFNEDRPNVSARVAVKGSVDLSAVLDESLFKKDGGLYIAEHGMAGAGMVFPVDFPTGIFRNYTVIRDGVRNVDILPVSLTPETRAKLVANGVVLNADYARQDGPQIELLDLTRVPLINRKMVQEVSAKALFEAVYQLTKTKAEQKVFNYYAKQMLPSKSSRGMSDLYGGDVGAWLEGLGLKDGGFNPKVTLQPPTESYMSKELKVAIAGLSSLPKVEDVIGKKGSLTISQELLAGAIKQVEEFLASPAYTGLSEGARGQLLDVWLSNKQRETTAKARQMMREIAKIKFSVIVGQVWFSEFASLDENSLDMTFGGKTVKVTANLKEAEIKV